MRNRAFADGAARSLAAMAATGLLLLPAVAARAQSSLPLETIRLPAGFVIELVARVPNARAMVAIGWATPPPRVRSNGSDRGQ